ncbi:MAG: shikimate dehydrogenase [Candidatus Eisenbacteria bacterium]|nr:shikimate dehydrogenase [Candidatus Eisenbacteria bacterium]
MPAVDASTALYGVAGWPLRDTLSPRLHNAAFTALGIPAVYVPLRVRPERGDGLIAALETLGMSGANVTVPHKEAAFRGCDRLSPAARAARSVNTLVRAGSGWTGHTTDGEGLLDALARAAHDPACGPLALLGGGGSARSAAVALLRRGGLRLRLITRDPHGVARALAHADDVGAGSSLEILARGSEAAARALRSARTVLNATTLGSGSGRGMPCPPAWLRADAVAVDFVYGAPTPWRTALRARGITAFSGLGMLICQAARSFRIWTGKDPLEWMLWAGGWDREMVESGAGAGTAGKSPPGGPARSGAKSARAPRRLRRMAKPVGGTRRARR